MGQNRHLSPLLGSVHKSWLHNSHPNGKSKNDRQPVRDYADGRQYCGGRGCANVVAIDPSSGLSVPQYGVPQHKQGGNWMQGGPLRTAA